MSILEIFERIQETGLSRAIAESTWGYPIVGALHVLAIAFVAGWTLLAARRNGVPVESSREIRRWKAAGFVLVLLTGLLLFISQPVHYYGRVAFRVKLVLIALAILCAALRQTSRFPWMTLVLWAAVIFAARGIAYF